MQKILELARQGDRAALGAVLEHHRHYLTLLARIQIGRRLQAKADPSDVVQEVFLDANRQFGQFRGNAPEEVEAWLRRLLAGHLARLIRRYFTTEARDARLEVSLEHDLQTSSNGLLRNLASPDQSPSESIVRREELFLLASYLERLTPDYREVILLRQVEGLPFAEIATRLDRSVDSIQKLWARAVLALRQQMNEPRPEDSSSA